MIKEDFSLKLKKTDVILILSLLAVSAVLCLIFFLNKTPGGEAVVTVDGEEIMVLPLDEDIEVQVGQEETHNIVSIHDGKVCIKDATCPDKVCVHTGEISNEGETIVCLPHKLVVSIRGGKPAEVDASTK